MALDEALEPRLVHMTIRLEGTRKDRQLFGSRLQIFPDDKEAPMRFMQSGMFLARPVQGIPLAPGQREYDLWLPPGDYKLRVYGNEANLGTGTSFRTQALAEQSMTVQEGAEQKVTVEVAEPPTNEQIERR